MEEQAQLAGFRWLRDSLKRVRVVIACWLKSAINLPLEILTSPALWLVPIPVHPSLNKSRGAT